MKIQSRKLRVLVIDDKDVRAIDTSWPNLEFIHISQFVKLTEMLATGSSHQGADIFLVDLNMENLAHIPQALQWGAGQAPSFGIILALPFLRADRPAAFVPYSSNWGQVASNGYVVVATALLLSAERGSPETLNGTCDWISKPNTLGNTPEALRRGLFAYRENVKRFKKGRLLNVNRAIERLGLLQQAGPVSTKLHDGQGPIAIGVSSSGDRIDWLDLASIFADVINDNSGPTLTENRFKNIVAHLMEWKNNNNSIDVDRNLYYAARDLLSICSATKRPTKTWYKLQKNARPSGPG